MGTRKASRFDGSAQEKMGFLDGRPQEIAQNLFHRFSGDVFPGPHVERRATQGLADKARGLFEARRAEFRSARQYRVAQGSRQRRPRNLGSPSSLATFFLAKQEESTPAPPARNSAVQQVRQYQKQVPLSEGRKLSRQSKTNKPTEPFR
jgi:hypothetical protein